MEPSDVFLYWTMILIFGMHGTSATDRPREINVTNVRYNSLTVVFDEVIGAATYNVQLQARHDPSVTYQMSTTDTNVTFTGIASNTLYEVKVNASNPGNYTTARARTPPNGVAIVTSVPLPELFTVFLEEIPGASQWEIEVLNIDEDSREVFVTLPDTYYARIIRDRTPNTIYQVCARVSILNGVAYDNDSSPFGSCEFVTTAMTSLFGRVLINDEEFLPAYGFYSRSSREYLEAKDRMRSYLKSNYTTKYSFVHDVLVLGLENSNNTVVCHHEILVTNRTTELKTELSLEDDNFADLRIVQKVDDGSEVVLFHVSETDRWESLYVPTPEQHQYYEERDLLLNSQEGEHTMIPFPGEEIKHGPEISIGNFGTLVMVLNSAGIDSFESTPGMLAGFNANTVYSIDQMNTHQTQSIADGLQYFSRDWGSFHTHSTENDSFLHSGGPLIVPPTALVSVTAINQGHGLRLIFQRFNKAVRYNVTVNGLATVTKILHEDDLDGSSTYQVAFDDIGPTATDITGNMTLTTRNHEGTELESPPYDFIIPAGTFTSTVFSTATSAASTDVTASTTDSTTSYTTDQSTAETTASATATMVDTSYAATLSTDDAGIISTSAYTTSYTATQSEEGSTIQTTDATHINDTAEGCFRSCPALSRSSSSCEYAVSWFCHYDNWKCKVYEWKRNMDNWWVQNRCSARNESLDKQWRKLFECADESSTIDCVDPSSRECIKDHFGCDSCRCTDGLYEDDQQLVEIWEKGQDSHSRQVAMLNELMSSCERELRRSCRKRVAGGK